MAQNKFKCLAFVDMLTKLRVSQKEGNVLTG
jgi:hypothetical protein